MRLKRDRHGAAQRKAPEPSGQTRSDETVRDAAAPAHDKSSVTEPRRPGKPNRLVDSKSPYLLQHARNPVDWFPWGEEAFSKAERENKPVFLSIGYSTCHWCHVMARESFEDPGVASLLSDYFVAIKVDREERPDIDDIYMTICQLMTGGGGWPLTIVMTPDQRPFFATTYLPRNSTPERLGLTDLLPRIAELWSEQHDEVVESSSRIVSALAHAEGKAQARGADHDLSPALLDGAMAELADEYDEEQGGFGIAPKFPNPHKLSFLLRYWKRTGDPRAKRMVDTTLRNMRRGGIFDHLGYGIHRYSTDRFWLVPHFEKMLYDQALLTISLIETYQATSSAVWAQTSRDVISYVLGEMTSPEGGFYSAEDAESEEEEGKYHVWTYDEVTAILTEDEARFATLFYNILPEGNFADEATHLRTGKNILSESVTLKSAAEQLELSEQQARSLLNVVRDKLLAARQGRVRPHTDDKILTDWNGLMIAALAKAGFVLRQSEYVDAARRAAEFLTKHMRLHKGGLLHRYRDGDAAIQGKLNDYAFLIWGLLEIYDATFDTKYLIDALALTKEQIAAFWDEERGGFFVTASDDERLLVRRKDAHDGATPSGNSVSALNLLRLGLATDDPALTDRGRRTLQALSASMAEFPSAHTQALIALDWLIGPARQVTIVGDPLAEDTRAMIRTLSAHFFPNKVVIVKSVLEKDTKLVKLAPHVAEKRAENGHATAYVCSEEGCQPPTTYINELLRLLSV